MPRSPMLSCALTLIASVGLMSIPAVTDAGLPPDDDFSIVAGKGRIVTNAGGERVGDRLDSGSWQVTNADAVEGELVGDVLSVEFSLDADQRRRGRVFKLSGDDVSLTSDAGTTAFDDVRGRMGAKQNRNGDHLSKIKIKASNDDGERLKATARGRENG
ncbi:MAG: hypothetical protein AAF842_09210 [Planctomycetota bacterium]